MSIMMLHNSVVILWQLIRIPVQENHNAFID